MSRLYHIAIILILICAVGLTEAYAKRLGGGSSFGSRPSYGSSFSSSSRPNNSFSGSSGAYQPQGQSMPGSMNQNAGPYTQAPTYRPQGGLFGGMGGMLGGMLMGGFLSSMLFGHRGYGMGGGFGGIGIFDILILGLVAWLLFRMVTRSRRDTSQSYPQPDRRYEVLREQQNDSFWGNLENQPARETNTTTATPNTIPGVDTAEFLKGAKTAYVRLQKSWDARDLADIAQFATPDFLAEIKRQAAADPNPGRTDIIQLKAELVEMREVGSDLVGSVLFNSLLREDGETESKTVREVWHFSRPQNDPKAFWRLEGLQQYED